MKFQKPFLYSKQIVLAYNKKKIDSLIKRMAKQDYEFMNLRKSKFNGMEYATLYFIKQIGI